MLFSFLGRAGGILLALIVLPSVCFGQGRPHEYTATCSGTLSAAATTCTLQIPASNGYWILLKTAFVQTTAQATVSQERDGTAATTTLGTVRKRNPNASWVATSSASVYSSSNVGAGTPVGTPVTIGASPSYIVLGAEGTILEKGAAGARSYSIKLASMTGDYVITFEYEQRENFP